jgi:hypothetical protein
MAQVCDGSKIFQPLLITPFLDRNCKDRYGFLEGFSWMVLKTTFYSLLLIPKSRGNSGILGIKSLKRDGFL